ncbi:hypothetical protein BU16DRAFT_583456 [Lophium mytilinum]|uniref:BZIP domain-containing protein n=1 Tax=Lophium mytilinum TaxID=390894 RepID=A0A6A6QR59_9PEZI|nr:hypothetical protein BU16DRAFT_583456 [Lophium mytilinum]
MVPTYQIQDRAVRSVEEETIATYRPRRTRSTTVPDAHARETVIRKPSVSPTPKPTKVNSEARKQQNRIASRNYREKRKRKLQFLEQLLENDPSSSGPGSSTGSPEPALDDQLSLGLGHDVSPHLRSVQLQPLAEGNYTQTGSVSNTVGYHESPLGHVCPQTYNSPDPTWPPVSYPNQSHNLESYAEPWAHQPWITSVPYYSREPFYHQNPPMITYQPATDPAFEPTFNMDGNLSLGGLNLGSASNTPSPAYLDAGTKSTIPLFDPRSGDLQKPLKDLTIRYNLSLYT